jgi:Arm DNA-binding domain
MPRLTKKFVEAAEPAEDGKDYLLWDEAVKGFGVRVYASGIKSFVFRYRALGSKQRFLSLGKVGDPYTVEEAREKTRDAMRVVMEGGDPQEQKTQKRTAWTIQELCAAYLSEAPAWRQKKRQSSWDADASLVKWHIVPLLGKKLAEQVTRRDVVTM